MARRRKRSAGATRQGVPDLERLWPVRHNDPDIERGHARLREAEIAMGLRKAPPAPDPFYDEYKGPRLEWSDD